MKRGLKPDLKRIKKVGRYKERFKWSNRMIAIKIGKDEKQVRRDYKTYCKLKEGADTLSTAVLA